jgi:sterol 3beta-glucosyltransferase
MRIAIIAIGSRGDVQPYVALGAGLRRAGHAVRLTTHPRFADLLGDSGVEFAPVAEGALSRGDETPAGRMWARWGAGFLPHWVGLLQDGASVARRRLADGWNATEGVDAIVVSPLGTLLGWQLAEARGVALVRAYYAPRPARMTRTAVRQAVWLCARPWVNRARAAALDLPPLPLTEPLGALDREGVPVLYGFSPAVVPPPAECDWVEVTGYWLLDTPVDWTPPAHLTAFLAAGDSPVLVTFGDMGDRDPDRTTAVLLDALARAGRRGILVRGPYLARNASLPDGVIAVDPLPFDWLFPRLAAAVHHGGAGTTAAALRAGVPSVVVPAIADQPFWARRVQALGVGPAPIPRSRLSAERLADAIRVATTDAGVRRRAAALALRIAGEDGGGAAVAAFERQIARWAGRADGERIATRPRPRCVLCGARGVPLYRHVRDRLHGAPGVWSVVRCPAPGCGLLWLDPVPTEEDLGKAYRTYYTHRGESPPRLQHVEAWLAGLRRAYLGSRLGYGQLLPSRRRRFAAVLAAGLIRAVPGGRDAMVDTACHLHAPAAGARLLEVGFGSGRQLARMRDLGWEVSGVDVDPVVVAAARERGLDVREGHLAAQRFPAGRFDAVYLSHVIEHVHDPVALLGECARVLKPAGTLVAITPNVDSRGHRRFGEAWFGLDPPRHLVLFSPAALREAALRAGFADADVRSSARIAFITSIGSVDILRRGRVTSFDGAVPVAGLARGLAAQITEAAALTVRPDAGEEIVLRAAKTTADTPPAPTTPEHQELPCTFAPSSV